MYRHVGFLVLDGNMKRKAVQAEIDKYLAEKSGVTYGTLVMRKGVCTDEQDAKDYLDHYRHGEQKAVEAIQFVIRASLEPTQEENDLADRGYNAHKEYENLQYQEYLDTIQFDRFRCPHCDCEFPHDLILERAHKAFNSNKCIVCNEDYRPKGLLDEIDRLRKISNDCEWNWEQKHNERLRKERALDVYKWVVRIEWYEDKAFKP